MHDTVIRSNLTTTRQIQIGRLTIDNIAAEQPFVWSWERVEAVRDAFYILAIPVSGCVTFTQNGQIRVTSTGEYILLSQLGSYELSSAPRSQLLMVHIPATELRGRLVSVEDHVGGRFGANERMTCLLVDLVKGIAELFADRAPPNPQALATEIVSFVALTIGTEDRGAAIDVRNTRYQLRRRIFDFIEKNLGDQHLSPKKIAGSSRISMSYLYSLFNDDETTVGQFVQVKRLQKAYEILVADPKGHRTVAEVAFEVGFKNVSHFSRSFSRHFSIAPRDVRQLGQASVAGAEPVAKPGRNAIVRGKVAASPSFGTGYWEADKQRALHETA
jgi:AraC-like DNA-binding protein